MLSITAYIPEMIQIRRELHRHPEIAWTEFFTTEKVVHRVRELGFKTVVGKALFNEEYTYGRVPEKIAAAEANARASGVDAALLDEIEGYTGCMAIMETGRPGPVTCFRFDMDCVNVEELHSAEHVPAKEGFDSTVPGLMHACGHDAHTAVGLAVAHWVADNLDQLNGTIKLIFQPAEEGTKGACGIAHTTLFDDVDYFVAGHVGVTAALHQVAIVREGFMATTKMNATFTGKASHAGGSPELGRNALMASCAAAMQLMAIPRHGKGGTCVNVGTLHAGEGRNVVPAHATMEFEVRGENHDINVYMQETAKRIIAGCAATYGVEHKVEIVGAATNMVADKELSDAIGAVAGDIPTITKVFDMDSCSGSEDCSYMMRKVQEHGGQIAFFFFGCNHNGHHQCDFDIQDTESLPEALAIFTGLLEKLNK